MLGRYAIAAGVAGAAAAVAAAAIAYLCACSSFDKDGPRTHAHYIRNDHGDDDNDDDEQHELKKK